MANITIEDDDIIDDDESFTCSLSMLLRIVVDPNTATITITDDDGLSICLSMYQNT